MGPAFNGVFMITKSEINRQLRTLTYRIAAHRRLLGNEKLPAIQKKRIESRYNSDYSLYQRARIMLLLTLYRDDEQLEDTYSEVGFDLVDLYAAVQKDDDDMVDDILYAIKSVINIKYTDAIEYLEITDIDTQYRQYFNK